jgi:hypothetical protein
MLRSGPPVKALILFGGVRKTKGWSDSRRTTAFSGAGDEIGQDLYVKSDTAQTHQPG